MSDVTLSPSGPPETILPEPPADIVELLATSEDMQVVASVVASNPSLLEGWASMGDLAERSANSVEGRINAYASYRVGYHRGLDQLRGSGWKGSGYVRWRNESNRGFLRCLAGLARMAETIGETDEARRCEEFLGMLDPDWPPERRQTNQ